MSIWGRVAFPASVTMSAAITADTGDAINPCCAAITVIESGRSGRMPALRATSAITGSSA
jgi:hypothetical protein